MRKRKRWFIATAVVIVLGLSYLAYSLFIHSGVEYLTVSELKSQVESIPEQRVIVEGKIVAGSISWNDKTKAVRFALADDKESLTIVYEGVIPDSFKPGNNLVVEGKYRPDNIFEALSLGSRRSFCDACH